MTYKGVASALFHEIAEALIDGQVNGWWQGKNRGVLYAAEVCDPVQSGLVASLSHPGGNVTGNSGLTIDLEAKRLELLTELAPTARLIGALVNPNRPGVEGHQSHDSQRGVFCADAAFRIGGRP